MAALLFVLLLVVPVVELWVIVEVAGEIGAIPTLVLLLVVSVAGAWLLKQQGTATWRRMRETLRRGRMPTQEVTDGALILLGGALLLTPGFLTDAVGLALLIPPTRAPIKALIATVVARRARRRLGAQPRVQEARVVKVERSERPKPASDRAENQLPSSERPDDGGDSRDTR
ncbi:MAG: FxsA family protein [Actinomycetota bacterium]|nr:FxsA family protein [Actinomycetota bacterium]